MTGFVLLDCHGCLVLATVNAAGGMSGRLFDVVSVGQAAGELRLRQSHGMPKINSGAARPETRFVRLGGPAPFTTARPGFDLVCGIHTQAPVFKAFKISNNF